MVLPQALSLVCVGTELKKHLPSTCGKWIFVPNLQIM